MCACGMCRMWAMGYVTRVGHGMSDVLVAFTVSVRLLTVRPTDGGLEIAKQARPLRPLAPWQRVYCGRYRDVTDIPKHSVHARTLQHHPRMEASACNAAMCIVLLAIHPGVTELQEAGAEEAPAFQQPPVLPDRNCTLTAPLRTPCPVAKTTHDTGSQGSVLKQHTDVRPKGTEIEPRVGHEWQHEAAIPLPQSERRSGGRSVGGQGAGGAASNRFASAAQRP